MNVTISFISRVIADGRLTIPKNLRKTHQINEGDFVEVHILRKVKLEAA